MLHHFETTNQQVKFTLHPFFAPKTCDDVAIAMFPRDSDGSKLPRHDLCHFVIHGLFLSRTFRPETPGTIRVWIRQKNILPKITFCCILPTCTGCAQYDLSMKLYIYIYILNDSSDVVEGICTSPLDCTGVNPTMFKSCLNNSS